jgi:2-polyprenyl-3-methyl-5-hydroxy-6-metoxy-1,4-benzoquinol methylase
MNEVIKNRHNFYSLKNVPSVEDLQQYYKDMYYQEGKGGYETAYQESDITYFNNKMAEKAFIIDSNLDKNLTKSLLDIGCGEGWSLNFFKKKGYNVTGMDFSSFGCEKCNPDCIENMIIGDIYESIDKLIQEKKKFSVIFLLSVLEHVTDPEFLINKIEQLIDPSGIFVVEVPNDFSIIQEYALSKGYIENKFWVVAPDHISYFSKESLENLMRFNGWEPISFLADYPIDWNLLNPNTNYVKDKSKGKSCHRERIELDNLIHTRPIEQVVNFYKSMSDLGMGRLIGGFFRPGKIRAAK